MIVSSRDGEVEFVVAVFVCVPQRWCGMTLLAYSLLSAIYIASSQ